MLEEAYSAVTSATHQGLYEKLDKSTINQGQGPHGFLYIMETARDRLHGYGEHLSLHNLGALQLHASISCRNREFRLKNMKWAISNVYSALLF